MGRGTSLEDYLIPGAQGVGLPEGDGGASVNGARRIPHPAGSWTTARKKRTAQQPGRPSPFLDHFGATENPVTLSGACAQADRAPAAKKSVRIEVGRWQGEPEPRPMGARESEGCIRAETSGNGVAPGPGRAKAARVDVNFRREPCPTHRRWVPCHRDS